MPIEPVGGNPIADVSAIRDGMKIGEPTDVRRERQETFGPAVPIQQDQPVQMIGEREDLLREQGIGRNINLEA
ncbi:MAG: hypothetical protein QME40_04310 [bacterium]|nr:hypothetical protein [bacterium]